MLGETVGRSCGLGSGVEGCLSKGTGPWGTAKTTNIFCAFQIYQGQAIPLPFSLWGPGVLGHETQPDCLGETFFFTIHVMARSHLETSAPWVKVQGLVSPKHAQVSLHVCINIYIYTHMCVCVYICTLPFRSPRVHKLRLSERDGPHGGTSPRTSDFRAI